MEQCKAKNISRQVLILFWVSGFYMTFLSLLIPTLLSTILQCGENHGAFVRQTQLTLLDEAGNPVTSESARSSPTPSEDRNRSRLSKWVICPECQVLDLEEAPQFFGGGAFFLTLPNLTSLLQRLTISCVLSLLLLLVSGKKMNLQGESGRNCCHLLYTC